MVLKSLNYNGSLNSFPFAYSRKRHLLLILTILPLVTKAKGPRLDDDDDDEEYIISLLAPQSAAAAHPILHSSLLTYKRQLTLPIKF